MSEAMRLWLMVVGSAFVVVLPVGLVLLRRDRRRRRALQKWATANGWTYRRSGSPWADWQDWSGPYYQGPAYHAVNGTWHGRPFALADVLSNDRNYPRGISVIGVQLPRRLPTLSILTAGLGGLQVLEGGGSRIEFESEDFNRGFDVRCTEPRFASEFVAPRVMQLILAAQPTPNLEIHGDHLIWWQPGWAPLRVVNAALVAVNQIIDAVPALAWEDWGREFFDPGLT